MNRLDVSERDKVDKMYGKVPLLQLISKLSDKYSLPPYQQGLRPEEIFQAVMARIDELCCSANNERLTAEMQQAWNRQWREVSDLAERSGRPCQNQEIEELTCVILYWEYECLLLLTDESVAGNLWYFRFAHTLLEQLMAHTLLWMKVRGEISPGLNEGNNREMLRDWIVAYVEGDKPLYTDVDGHLILQSEGYYLYPPQDSFDSKLYSVEAQKIWKVLVEKKWCEKQGSMLFWNKSNLSLGYLVKMVANRLGVIDPAKNEVIIWSSFTSIFKNLADSTVVKQAKNGASKINLNTNYRLWPKDARDLRLWLKSI